MSSETQNDFFPPEEGTAASDLEETEAIDLQALAEEIMRLLKRELMIENERRGR